jgi:hypothetical protein
MIQLDILGRGVTASPPVIAQLRDLAAARAGQSLSQRDLSRVECLAREATIRSLDVACIDAWP